MFGFNDAVRYCGGPCMLSEGMVLENWGFLLVFQRILIWVTGQLGFWEEEKGDIELGR